MSCCESDHIKELLSLYVDDACSDLEKQMVMRHIALCADCCRELAELQWIVASLREMPDIPLPPGFAEAWQERLQAEIAAEEEPAANVVVPEKPSRKHWWMSRRFVGVAATVLLCFSVSVIGGHINRGYDHLLRNNLHQEMEQGALDYNAVAARQTTTAVADDAQYNGGIFSGLSASKTVRNDDGQSSSRDGSAIEHYILEELDEMNAAPMPEDGGPGVDVENAEGVTPTVVFVEPGNGDAENGDAENAPTSAVPTGELGDNKKVVSAQNSQLQTKAAHQVMVAQSASNKEVYNGYMALVTEDVSGVRNQVMAVAGRYDGYVNEEAVFSDGDDKNIRLEICVKSEHLETAMTDIAGFGEVTAKSIDRVDLSEAYYDAQGRLTRQRALEQSLLRLIAEAEDIETIRALEQELEKVTAEIEAIIANLEKISQQRKYSAIVVNISSDPFVGQASATIGDKFSLGLQSFIGFCQSFPDNLLVGFGFMFEIFAVVLILLILFYLVMHKLLRKPAAAVSRKNEPEK